jgi:hypothetical protein
MIFDPTLKSIHVNLRADLASYVERKPPRTPFLRAVLENDLGNAIIAASGRDLLALSTTVHFIKTYFPETAYGSPEKVTKWTNH